MTAFTRRAWLTGIARAGAGALGTATAAAHAAERPHAVASITAKKPLALRDYEPKSMLHVAETHVPRARFPCIDFHTHMSWVEGRMTGGRLHQAATPAEVLPVMERKNIRIIVNLTGGYGPLLDEALNYWQRPHPER